jgi:GntR family transcriptional regulator
MEFENNQAIYLQIADYICEKILCQEWPVGERIPSVREMAISVAVNPNTVMRTYTYLEDAGIISMRRGIGYFLSQDAYVKTLKLKKAVFLKQEVPRFLKKAKLLNINFQELKKQFETI